MNSKEALVAVQKVIKKAPFTLHDLARESGVSYDALRSWAADRRTPRPTSVARLASGLRKKARSLLELADRLDETPPA